MKTIANDLEKLVKDDAGKYTHLNKTAKHIARYADLVKRGLAKPQQYDLKPVGSHT